MFNTLRRMGWVLVLASAGFFAATAHARVTERVNAMIAENTPLKVKDSDLWIMIGPPLAFGIQYDKYATANLALGGGVGSYLDGVALDLSIKYYFLQGKFSPFLNAGGAFYYSRPEQNIFAFFATAGLAYFFDDGLGLSIGVGYVKSISESREPFSYQFVNDKINAAFPQFGFHWNF